MIATRFDTKGRQRFTGVQVTDYIADVENGLLLIALEGAEQAVRSCWANIVEGRKKRNICKTNVSITDGKQKFWVRVNPLKRYTSFPTPSGGILLLREEFSRANGKYIFGGDDETPSPWFENALRSVPTMPYKQAWLPVLWQAGIEKSLIVAPPTDRSTVRVWRLKPFPKPWTDLLGDLVRSGELI